jgi:hypothetical protein
MVLGMSLTLTCADRAELPASRDLRPRRRRDVLRLAAEQADGCIADVSAVEAHANAPAHLGDVVLGEIRIRARHTGLQTREALVDAPGQEVAIELSRGRVGFENLSRHRRNGHGVLLVEGRSG